MHKIKKGILKMKATKIKWNYEPADMPGSPLPDEISIPYKVIRIDMAVKDTSFVYEERLNAIGEYITNKTGYTHDGFSVDVEHKDLVKWSLAKTGEDLTEYAFYVEGSLDYAAMSDMCLIDFDEWNAIAKATGLQLTWEDARQINYLLWEKYDFSALDCPETDNPKTVREAILDELTPEDEKLIYDILKKYDGNTLCISTSV